MIRYRRCGHCASPSIRRAMSRTEWQRFVRALTPLRRYQCMACNRRGWMFGALPSSAAGETSTDGGTVGRPIEDRDLEEVANRRFRIAIGAFLAVVLGVLVALWLLRVPVE